MHSVTATTDPYSTSHPASVTPVTTSANPGPSVRPLTRDPIRCFNGADFPDRGEINSDYQDSFALYFGDLNDGTIRPGDAPIKSRGKDNNGVNYDYSVEWVGGCVTTVEKQSFRYPLGTSQSLTAYVLVREDYTKCKWLCLY
ncbi:uncharacterized protein B0H64DRAFT_398176 [Chaetomium fimeti]|uniref:Uncharacterized protein n=1 Tax=Chaetomium fimeti TaxID=1854472 RepID=A0AAE0LT69_9PEZI|nr:hypothetical protein B0H64DRAFT_398176 [Chaetomium fimeti]